MADFKTHITTSSILGIGYGVAGAYFFQNATGEIPYTSCVLAGGLCSLSGMLPDLDSDSGVPLRESMAFGAAVVPMLMMDRFVALGMSHDAMVLAGGLIYLVIRFGFARLLKKFTVHRGMFHSIPAMLIAGLLAFLICACDDLPIRYYRAGAVLLGFGSHLLLDEIWSIEWRGGRFRLKKSFGTAFKFWGSRTFASISTYATLVILTALAFGDPIWMDQVRAKTEHIETATSEIKSNLHQTALDAIEKIWR